MKEYILSHPVFTYLKCPAILSCIIMPVCRNRRIILVLAAPCPSYILIDRMSISVEFPHSRDRHIIPVPVIIAYIKEIHRTRRNAFIPLEFPDSVQRQFQAFCIKCRGHRDTIAFNDVRILPIRKFCCIRCSKRSRTGHKDKQQQ